MSLGVDKDCFPTPTGCHNCERKWTSQVRKKTIPKEEYKRCSSCHLMTYCDKDCQKEHWIRVHKKHCKFLSGKVPVNNSVHNVATCLRCIDQKQASLTQIRSKNSPKTVCTSDKVNITMKKYLSEFFDFHKEGKKCNCTLLFAAELPFPLGEVSGRYMEIGGTGLDAMLAHALTIVDAMENKAGTDLNIIRTLGKLEEDIITERLSLWLNILVKGIPTVRKSGYLSDQVDSLKPIYGPSNAWWKALKFSVDLVVQTNDCFNSICTDPRISEDPRLPHLKQINDYRQSQLQNQASVCEKQMWAKVMLWPVLLNGSLAIVLPPGTNCQNCFTELYGEVAISAEEKPTLPILLPEIGSNGALMASCPMIRNPSCAMICLFKNVTIQMRMDKDENQYKQFIKEKDLFEIESRDCDFCLKLSLFSHRCSACLTVQYCSITCQKKDLDFHKTVCTTWAKDKSRRILGKGKQKVHYKELVDKESFKK